MSKTKSNRVLLIDQSDHNPLSIVESYVTPEGPHTNAVIATLYGVLSDFGNETRNGRYYSESLWRKVFEGELFNELLRTKTLFGEPDHPMDVESRVEVHIPYVSHIIRDPKINEDTQCVEGYLDILDTPYGRIVKTLIDYGCELGVSSRGSGELISSGGKVYVDENKYNFITWDIVARPSNKKARTHEIDTVNLDPLAGSKTVYEFMEDQIKNMVLTHDKKSLQLTESLLSSTEIPNKEDLIGIIKESLESSETKELELDDTPQVTKSDLDDAYKRIIYLKKENSELEALNKELIESLDNAQNTISELSELNENLQSMVSSYMEKLSELELRTTADDEVAESSDDNHLAPEMKDPDYSEIIETIRKGNDEMLRRISDLQGEMKSSEEYEDENNELLDKVDELTKEIELVSDKLDNSQKENIKLIRKHSSVINEYFKLRCSVLGINEQIARTEFRNRLSEYDVKDIDEVLTEMYSTRKGGAIGESITDQPLSHGSIGSLTLSGSQRSSRPSQYLGESVNKNDSDVSQLASAIRQVRKS